MLSRLCLSYYPYLSHLALPYFLQTLISSLPYLTFAHSSFRQRHPLLYMLLLLPTKACCW
ncbi:hypothetical protein BDW59DRAFT_68844 [Aspergillus cavernicola]|uniref:Uncharacterized protein n=1 Tax=Aspergillus cavernicola TaxID=176166 RepID=A0ABR4IE04_9EURO